MARVEDRFVVNRNTALANRGDPLKLTELGLARGMRYVITGSVRGAAGGLWVGVRLIAENASLNGFDRFRRHPLRCSTMSWCN